MFRNNPRPTHKSRKPEVSPRKLAAASKAIAALVGECMASESPHKFATAARLCDVGQRLVKAVSVSAADHIEDVAGGTYVTYNAAQDGVFEGVQEVAAPIGPRRLIPEADHMLAGLRTVLEPNQKAERGEREARELDCLLKTKRDKSLGTAQRKVIEARIDQLLNNMKERCCPNGTKDVIECPVIPPEGLPVSLVPTVMVRGHQAGAQGGEGDAAPVPRPDARGAGRPARTTRRRRPEQVG